MGRRSDGETLRIIKERMSAGAFRFRIHAYEEMADENISSHDAFHAIANGAMVAVYDRDPRGTRYAVRGPDLDGFPVIAVCRFFDDRVQIVTMFRVR